MFSLALFFLYGPLSSVALSLSLSLSPSLSFSVSIPLSLPLSFSLSLSLSLSLSFSLSLSLSLFLSLSFLLTDEAEKWTKKNGGQKKGIFVTPVFLKKKLFSGLFFAINIQKGVHFSRALPYIYIYLSLSLSLPLWQCCYRSHSCLSISLSVSLWQCCFRSQVPVFKRPAPGGHHGTPPPPRPLPPPSPRPQRLQRRGASENFPEYFYGSERGYYSTQKRIPQKFCYVIAPGAITGFSCRAPENNSKIFFLL